MNALNIFRNCLNLLHEKNIVFNVKVKLPVKIISFQKIVIDTKISDKKPTKTKPICGIAMAIGVYLMFSYCHVSRL